MELASFRKINIDQMNRVKEIQGKPILTMGKEGKKETVHVEAFKSGDILIWSDSVVYHSEKGTFNDIGVFVNNLSEKLNDPSVKRIEKEYNVRVKGHRVMIKVLVRSDDVITIIKAYHDDPSLRFFLLAEGDINKTVNNLVTQYKDLEETVDLEQLLPFLKRQLMYINTDVSEVPDWVYTYLMKHTLPGEGIKT